MDVNLQGVKFSYGKEGFGLCIPELQIDSGQRVAFIGPSGSGKTTLLNLLSGISVPQSGTLQIGNHTLHSMRDDARRAFRISANAPSAAQKSLDVRESRTRARV